ncbi:MAG: 3'(2'),5'-bisphosphate nucleotidase CysQ [Microthrixaceae bacterium]
MADAADHTLAADLVAAAGELLLDLRARLQAEGADLATIKDRGDAAAHALLMERLAAARPDDPVLSEESAAAQAAEMDAARAAAERVWIIDPLDGTREYGEGRDDWAVHVALAEDGRPTAGAVALPAAGLVLSTARPPVLPPAHGGAPRVLVSRSRPPVEAEGVARALGGELVPMGSAGAKAMAVVRGLGDVYPHSGGQYEWDNCAPVAVARAAGLHCSRLDGGELRYNRPDPYLPDLLVCRPELVAATLATLRRIHEPE